MLLACEVPSSTTGEERNEGEGENAGGKRNEGEGEEERREWWRESGRKWKEKRDEE